MKLNDLLKKPLFQNFHLIAGEAGLDKQIKNITMMDAPDIVHYLHENDFLVTTAYHLKDDPASITELVQTMHKQKCTALGIKTKRFLNEIPEAAIQYANDNGFPILEIPLETSLGEVVNASLQYILDQRTTELTTAFEIHRKFTQDILKGKGIKKLIDDLSAMIGQKVVLFDQHFHLHVSSQSKYPMENQISLLHSHGFQLLLGQKSHTCFTIRHTEETVCIFPIPTHIGKPAYLVILGHIPIHDQSLLLIIEQATNVLSFELMREYTVKQYAKRARNEFFINLVDSTFTSKEEIENRAKEFHLKSEQPFITVLGKIDQEGKQKSFTQYQLETEYIYEFLETEINKAPFIVHLFIKGDMCILLVEVEETSHEIDSAIIPYLKDMQTCISNIFKKTISFGISNISHHLINIPKTYIEAVSAIHTGQLSGNQQFIQVHRPKDVSEILRIIPTKDLQEFYDHIFQGFTVTHQLEEEQILLNTLSVYLETHCQISETAKRLFVHRNTVIYRLEKCEEILGRSLKDANTTFHLRLAFRIKTILQTQ
ncbi:PucR family transcriptional regulator [Niallia sp. NCCP-28]|uniref:PucR family transcriptional regulator n=1 Tax=Niallia sp. NCCP-28 TaxID=2934712 RepID=UPI002085576A|nr:PucR family transcriptional regulator [Niallia sp. NCCP-28]GKU83350.1 purine catabolism regulatory protein [Niallia sp. NCCP-28]